MYLLTDQHGTPLNATVRGTDQRCTPLNFTVEDTGKHGSGTNVPDLIKLTYAILCMYLKIFICHLT